MPSLSIRTLATAILGVVSSTAALFLWPPSPTSSYSESDDGSAASKFDSANYRARQWVNAGLFEDDRSGTKPLPAARNNKRLKAGTLHDSPITLTTATWQHRLAENDNWAILVSCSFAMEHERHLQWLKNVAKTYHDDITAGSKSSKELVSVAYVDAKESPELVALLQVRAYPSIRLLSLADAVVSPSTDTKAGSTLEPMIDEEQQPFWLRNFSRGLNLSADSFAHHFLTNSAWQHIPVYTELLLRLTKSPSSPTSFPLGSRDRAWSSLYAVQVRAFNRIYEAVDKVHAALVNWLVKHRKTFYPTVGAAGVIGFLGAQLSLLST